MFSLCTACRAFIFVLDLHRIKSYIEYMKLASPTSRNLEAEPTKTVRYLVTAAIAGSGKSREDIAVLLTKKIGETITAEMLNGWTSQSKKRLRFPVAFVPAFCKITGDDQLQRFALGQRLRPLLSLGEADLEKLVCERVRRKKGSGCGK